jgi:DNA-binding MarR family transcriptional regulator
MRTVNGAVELGRRPRKLPGGESLLIHWLEAVPNDRLAHLVKDVTRAASRALQLRLVQNSVSFGYWTFLRVLWERDGLTQRELSDEAGVMEPTTFVAVKAMEKLGIVERRRKPESGHYVYVYLTRKGRLLKDKLVPLAEEVNGIAVRGISQGDIRITRLTLLKMLENLVRDEIDSGHTSRRIPAMRRVADKRPERNRKIQP